MFIEIPFDAQVAVLKQPLFTRLGLIRAARFTAEHLKIQPPLGLFLAAFYWILQV